MSLPITPSAITRRARTILGIPDYGGVTSRKVRHRENVVEVTVGPAIGSADKRDEYAVRQRVLIDELTAEGYLAEAVGPILVRVQRREDVERQRAEIVAHGAAEAARLAPIVASLGGGNSSPSPEDWDDYQPGTPGDDFDDARPVPEVVAEARAILAEIEPDAGDVAAVTEDLPEHLRGDLDLIRRLALSRGSAYAQGWNDGHTTGIAEADDVLVDVRQRVQALKAHLWEDGDPADGEQGPQ